MPNPNKRLILANGEKYQEPVKKGSGGGPKELPRSYDEARTLVKTELTRAIEIVQSLPSTKRIADEAVLCLRLHPDMVAKSYEPNAIFARVPEIENIGSRSYRVSPEKVAQTKRVKKELEKKIREMTGRIVFVRSNDRGFKRLLSALEVSEHALSAEFRKGIQSIEHFDFLTPEEQMLGFGSDWKEGRVEIVLHPSRRSANEQTQFLKGLFDEEHVSWGKTTVASYPEGPLFVSCRLTRQALQGIAGAKPQGSTCRWAIGCIHWPRGR